MTAPNGEFVIPTRNDWKRESPGVYVAGRWKIQAGLTAGGKPVGPWTVYLDGLAVKTVGSVTGHLHSAGFETLHYAKYKVESRGHLYLAAREAGVK